MPVYFRLLSSFTLHLCPPNKSLLCHPSLLNSFRNLLLLTRVQSKPALSFLSFEGKYKLVPKCKEHAPSETCWLRTRNDPRISSCVVGFQLSTTCRGFQLNSVPQVHVESSDRPAWIEQLWVYWSTQAHTLSSQGWLMKRIHVASIFNLRNRVSTKFQFLCINSQGKVPFLWYVGDSDGLA